MTTPPKPSPEAVAASSAYLKSLCWESADSPQEVEARCALIIDESFASLRAKAELCDRLAAALRESLTFAREHIEEAIEAEANGHSATENCAQAMIHLDSCVIAITDYEATRTERTVRAAGPADAGGGRGGQ